MNKPVAQTSPSRNLRVGIHLPLGFAAGVPLLLTQSTLIAWLTDAGVSVESIGLFAWVGMPYTLKFLWAPLLDRYAVPLLDRRRGWILLTQFLLLCGIAVMGTMDPSGSLERIAMIALVVAVLSATQDIVVDAYRTDALSKEERGAGVASYILGYRIAMIVAGAGALVLSDQTSWRNVYWVMAALMLLGMVATWFAPRAKEMPRPPDLARAILWPLKEFFKRRGALYALAFLLLYKFGDALVSNVLPTFLLRDMGFSKTDLGLIQKLLGLAATIVGCSVGGLWADRIGLWKALMIFGVAQALANVGYLLLTLTGHNYPVLIAAIGIDNFCNGLGVAGLVVYIMSLCHRSYSATQYALFTSATVLMGRTLGSSAGYVAKSANWSGFFIISIVVSVPALVLLVFMKKEIDEREREGTDDGDDDDDDDEKAAIQEAAT